MSPQPSKSGSPARGGAVAARPAGIGGPMPKPRKRLVALILGLVFVAIALIVILGRGHVAEGSPPADAIAEVQGVEGGVVTQEDFDAALARVSEQQGLKRPPATDDPQYETIRDQALGELLLPLWISGEAGDRDVVVTDDEIADRTNQIVDQNFGSQKEFEKFVTEQGFCTKEEIAGGDPTQCAGVEQEVRVMLQAEKVQESVLGPNPEEAAARVPEDEVEEYYDENIAQFQTPATRDVRVIQNKDEAKVTDAMAELERDDSPKSWDAVAKKFSQDPVSKDRGGLLEGVVEGQSPGGPAFDEAVFGAAEGELVGPIETDNGFYAAQVEKITPAETTPLSEVEDQIRQQLAAQEQEQLATEFEQDFVSKWTELTVCSEEFANDRCVNFAVADPHQCTPEQASQGCPAPVLSRKPMAPGAISGDPLAALAQGPIPLPVPPAPAGLPTGLPPGVSLPPGGAPPGAVPPGAVPPGAAPPGAVPPGAAPPGAVPPGAPPTGAPPAAPPGGAPVPVPPPGG